MANPIIDSITISPNPVPPGQPAVITVIAHDPDQQSFTFTVVVSDSGGNETTGQGAFSVNDPLTYVGTVDGGTVTPGSTPGIFNWAP